MVGSDHKNDEDVVTLGVSLPGYSKLDQMPEVEFWCNRLPICGMGEIIYCFFFFSPVESLILSVNVILWRLCLWVCRNFRITVFCKLHMCFSSNEANVGLTTFCIHNSILLNLQKLKNNHYNIMDDTTTKRTAIYITLGLALHFLKPVNSGLHWLIFCYPTGKISNANS